MNSFYAPTVKNEIVRPIACRTTSDLLKMIDSCTSASMASYSFIEDYTQRRDFNVERPQDPVASELCNEDEGDDMGGMNIIIHQSPTSMDINDGCFDYPF